MLSAPEAQDAYPAPVADQHAAALVLVEGLPGPRAVLDMGDVRGAGGRRLPARQVVRGELAAVVQRGQARVRDGIAARLDRGPDDLAAMVRRCAASSPTGR